MRKPVTRASGEVERLTLDVTHDLVARNIWQALDTPDWLRSKS
ncbi:hypothetical protein [Fulvimarina manganoxydans]|nr:hypothetical protein [Fulvimarina manganoxydans]